MRTRHDGQARPIADRLASYLSARAGERWHSRFANPSVTIGDMAAKADSPTFQIIEMKLGRPLRPWIRSRRRRGDSWRAIALELYTLTNVDVTDETIRTWAPEQ